MVLSFIGSALVGNLPQPVLRLTSGPFSCTLQINGTDQLVEKSGFEAHVFLSNELRQLLAQHLQWRIHIRIDDGSSVWIVDDTTIKVPVHSSTVVVAARLEASPPENPWLVGPQSALLTCEMASRSQGVRGRGLEEIAEEAGASERGFGRFVDGWWEVVLQDPRPGMDEALFVEVVMAAIRVQSEKADVSMHAFNSLNRGDNTQPHAFSRPPCVQQSLGQGQHLLQQRVGKRARYLRISVVGDVWIDGVEAYCAEMLPREGSLPDVVQNVSRAHSLDLAIMFKEGHDWEKKSFKDVFTESRLFGYFLKKHFQFECMEEEQGQNVTIGWCGSTCYAAFLCFLTCALHQFCFVAYGAAILSDAVRVARPHVLVSEEASLPNTTILSVAHMLQFIRSLACRVCLEGHPLQSFTTPQAGFTCDICRNVQTLDCKMFSCRQCDFDVCPFCSDPLPSSIVSRLPRDGLGNMIFTSGSTGKPKATTRTHQELYAFLWLYAKGSTPDEHVHLAYQPFAHLNEQLGTLVCFLQGGCLAFSSSMTAYDDAKQVNPTAINGVPRFFEPLLGSFENKEVPLDQLRGTFGNRVHSVSTGSAPVTQRLLQFLRDCFECDTCAVFNSYGATEVGPIASNGVPNPNVELRIVPISELGHAEDGNIGEVRVRCRYGQVQAGGYLDSSLELDEEGFYRTGDVARWENGSLVLLGRVKNTSKLANGLFVSAEVLEEVYASEVPEVDQIFVIADSSEVSLFAVVVLHPWAQHLLDETQLLERLHEVAKRRGLQSHEHVCAMILEGEAWTVANGGLLEMQKLNWQALMKHYHQHFAFKQTLKQVDTHTDSMKMVQLIAQAQRRGINISALDLKQSRSEFNIDVAAQPPSMNGSVRPPSKLQRVFMTGATGLLGRHLVRCLLGAGIDVVAMVRTRSDFPEAVVQVVGDLALPSLGLNVDWNALNIDAIIHCGANVNWAFSYTQMRESNVRGTHEVVKLCARHCIPLHYISTISVAQGEDQMVDPRLILNPYVLTKWASEAHVRKAHMKGLVAAIYRPGMICGDSRTGVGKDDFFPDRFFRGCLQANYAVDSSRVCDLSPVDYVATVISRIILNGNCGSCSDNGGMQQVSGPSIATYNIYNPKSPNYTELGKLMGLPMLPPERFVEQLGPSNSLAPLLPLLKGSLPTAEYKLWGDSAVQRAIGEYYNPPFIDEVLVRTYLEHQRKALNI